MKILLIALLIPLLFPVFLILSPLLACVDSLRPYVVAAWTFVGTVVVIIPWMGFASVNTWLGAPRTAEYHDLNRAIERIETNIESGDYTSSEIVEMENAKNELKEIFDPMHEAWVKDSKANADAALSSWGSFKEWLGTKPWSEEGKVEPTESLSTNEFADVLANYNVKYKGSW